MAVLTAAAFFSKYSSIFADNSNRDISEQDMRDFAEDIKDSFQSIAGATTITSWKDPCVVATTANITLSGEQTIDGVLTSASRVLVKNQATTSQNGIYVSAAGAWSRATDADDASELEGAAVGVNQGTTNKNTVWLQTTDNVTLGSSAIAWQQVGYTSTVEVIDDDTFATATSSNVPSAESVKAYVDAGAIPDTALKHFFATDFTEAIYYAAGFSIATQAGGTFSNINDYGVDNTEKAFGVHGISTGANTTGAIRYFRGSYKFGFGNTVKLRWRIALSAVSDGTDTYTLLIGYTDEFNAYNTTPNGIYFKYSHSVNSGKWQCVTRASGTATSTDSGVAAGTTYDLLEIRVNSDCTSIGFYINDTLVQTHTTNLPSNTQLFMQTLIIKSAGTTPRLAYADFCDELITRTTSR